MPLSGSELRSNKRARKNPPYIHIFFVKFLYHTMLRIYTGAGEVLARQEARHEVKAASELRSKRTGDRDCFHRTSWKQKPSGSRGGNLHKHADHPCMDSTKSN